MAVFPATIELSSLNGSNGFKISGEAAGDIAGYPIVSAGDVNGDGFADVILGAYLADPHGDYSGASYVVFGRAGGFADNLDLSSLDGSKGFRLSGVAAFDEAGFSAASAGDVNGDGIADLIIGAPTADPHGNNSGASYVVFSHAGSFAANIELASLNGSNGFKLSGVAAGDISGISVASAGDMNGDGLADVIIGARLADPHGLSSGTSYVVFGGAGGFAPNIDLSSLNGSNGFTLSGEVANDRSGHRVASAGDVNGDGFADVIIGAPGADPHGDASGASYVVFGHAGGFAANIDLSALNGSNGFKLSGVAAGDVSGYSVASAGDFNGDGFADVIIGGVQADPNGNGSGAGYVVFGHGGVFAANIDLSSLDGRNGITLNGVAANDTVGNWVASAGDFNGDGFADVTLGAPNASPHGTRSGTSYIVFGHASEALSNSFNGDARSDILWQNQDGTPSIWLMDGTTPKLGAVAGHNPGANWHAVGAADFNRDGKDDILWQNQDGTPAVWLMDGVTPIRGALAGYNPGINWHVAGANDFNSDGRADIVWQNTDGTPSVWLMNGTAPFASTVAGFNPGAAWHVVSDFG